MNVAPVDAASWPEAQRLLAQTRMSARLPLVIERVADHEHSFPSLGGASLGLLARIEGRAVGFVHGRIEERQSFEHGGLVPQRLLYFGDLRVASEARRTGVALALLDALAAWARAERVDTGFCLVNQGNEGILRLLAGDACALRGRVMRSFTTATLVLPRRGAAAMEQTQAFAPIGRNAWLEPCYDRVDWPAFSARYPQIRYFGNAREGFALWDQAPLRALRVGAWPWRLRALEVTLTPRAPWGAAFEATLALAAKHARALLVNVVEEGGRISRTAFRSVTHVVGLGVDRAPPPAPGADVPLHVDLGFL